MLVYRICDKREIFNILRDESFINVGNVFTSEEKINTHTYQDNEKYMHFFSDFDSVFYLNTFKNNFICTYDIPESLLKTNLGLGFYYDRVNYKVLEAVCEYAINHNEINISYLKKIDQIIDYLDYLDYDYSNKLQTIYNTDANTLENNCPDTLYKVFKLVKTK